MKPSSGERYTRERSGGFVIYRIEEGSPVYLLLRSSSDMYWGLPKGKVDPGETDLDAARRELQEESGITEFEHEKAFEHTVTYWFARAGKKVYKTVHYFLARADSAQVKLSREHSESGWFTLREAREKTAFENLRRTLEEADRFILRT